MCSAFPCAQHAAHFLMIFLSQLVDFHRKRVFFALAVSIIGLDGATYPNSFPYNLPIYCHERNSPLPFWKSSVSHPDFPDGISYRGYL